METTFTICGKTNIIKRLLFPNREVISQQIKQILIL